MGLLSPWFLAGAAAVGLPIWLHLLKRAKTDPTPFPSLKFFENREVPSVHRRLDYILLFILRTLMVLLLALLFAHPYLETLAASNTAEALTVVAVDRSFSMRTQAGPTGTRLDQAKADALDELAQIPNGRAAQVVALAGTLEAMTQQVNDPAELQAAIAAIQPSDSRASFGELARYLRTLRESTEKPLEVHLFSDLQESALPPGFVDLRLENNTQLVYHQISDTEPNWTVETVVAPQHVFDPDTTHVVATVAGFDTPEAERNVALYLNGKQVAQQTVMVPENGRGSVEFVGLEAAYGFNQAEVRIDSADEFAQDDHFPFSVERTDPRKLLYIDDGRRLDAREFFESALTAARADEFSMEAVLPPAAANADLSQYSLVVVSDIGSYPNRLKDALEKYVADGGAVLVSAGANTVALGRVPVLDEEISGSHMATRNGERFNSATDVDITHPALRSTERFEGVRFFQGVDVNPGDAEVLARLNDGAPLILERHIGEGDVIAFTSTWDNISNDLPLKPAFVGFVQEAVDYLAGGGAEQPINLVVDDFVELRSGDADQGVTAEVTGPSGERILTLEESATAKNFTLSKEGFYNVRTAGGKTKLIAAHADRRESDLHVIPIETQEIWAATGETTPGQEAGAEGAIDETNLEAATEPWSLGPFILVLLLGVALAESVIADGYLRSRNQPQGA